MAEAADPASRATMNAGPSGIRSPTDPVTTSVARPPTMSGRARRRSPMAPPTSSRIADPTAPTRTKDSSSGRCRMADCTVDSDGPQTFGSRPAANSANEPATSEVSATPIVDDVGDEPGERRPRHTAGCYSRRSAPSAFDQPALRTGPGPSVS